MILRQKTAPPESLPGVERLMEELRFRNPHKLQGYGLFVRQLPEGGQVMLLVLPDEEGEADFGPGWVEAVDVHEHPWSVIVGGQAVIDSLRLNANRAVRPL